MFKIVVLAAVLAFALADVQLAIDALKKMTDEFDIPEDRKTLYKAAIDRSKGCLEEVAAGASSDRIEDYITKIFPMSMACNKEIKEIPQDHVEERRNKFKECIKGKIHGADSTLDDTQKEKLVKVNDCLRELV